MKFLILSFSLFHCAAVEFGDDILATKTINQATSTISAIQHDPSKKPEEKAAAIAEQKSRVDELTQKFPDSPQVQTSGARASLQLGDLKQAEGRADAAVTLSEQRQDPGALVDALKTRALALAAAGDPARANADAARALRLSPGDKAAQIIYALTKDRAVVAADAPSIEGGRPNGALQDLLDRVNRPPGFSASVGLTKNAETELKLGDYEAMYAKATAALKALPGNPRAYMQRAFASLMMGHYQDTIDDATAGLKLKPANAALLGLRAAAYNETGNPKQALEDAQKAVDASPKDPVAWLQKGLAREKLDPDDQYLGDIKNAADLDPSFEHFYAEALARRGQAKQQAKAAPSPVFPWKAVASSLILGIAGLLALKKRKRATDVVGGSFKLGELIGQGGMGSVYEAWDRNLERPVAIKRMNAELKDDPKEAAAFVREAKTVAALKHPNIVSIYDAFQEDGEIYLVFELVRGETLHDLVDKKGGKLPAAEALRLLEAMAAALDYAHARKIIHRDLKPANVMVEDGTAKIMDFGVARRTANPRLRTTTQRFVGTPAFMAPEQRRGEVSRESDLYSFALCARHMLGDAAAAPDVFAKALAEEPAQRYRSAAEFVAALSRAIL